MQWIILSSRSSPLWNGRQIWSGQYYPFKLYPVLWRWNNTFPSELIWLEICIPSHRVDKFFPLENSELPSFLQNFPMIHMQGNVFFGNRVSFTPPWPFSSCIFLNEPIHLSIGIYLFAWGIFWPDSILLLKADSLATGIFLCRCWPSPCSINLAHVFWCEYLSFLVLIGFYRK